MTELDLRAYGCPIPTMKTRKALKPMKDGEELTVIVEGKDAIADIRALVRSGGHTMSETRIGNTDQMTFVIKKG